MSAINMMAPPMCTPPVAHAPASRASLSAAILKVDRLMDVAFFPGRTERSPEYRAGCRAALEFRLARRQIRLPYVAGCAADDAFFAGVEEGHAIRRKMEDTVQ